MRASRAPGGSRIRRLRSGLAAGLRTAAWPGPSRERLAEEEDGEGEVGDDAVGGKGGGQGQRGRAEYGLGANDGAQGLRDDVHVAILEAPAIGEQPQATIVQRLQRGVTELAAQNDHGRVDLRPQVDPGSTSTAAQSARPSSRPERTPPAS